jgi:hypothetical protein
MTWYQHWSRFMYAPGMLCCSGVQLQLSPASPTGLLRPGYNLSSPLHCILEPSSASQSDPEFKGLPLSVPMVRTINSVTLKFFNPDCIPINSFVISPPVFRHRNDITAKNLNSSFTSYFISAEALSFTCTSTPKWDWLFLFGL